MRITQRNPDGNRSSRSAIATTTTDATTTETIAEAWRSTTVRRIVRRIFSILGMISSVRDIVRGVPFVSTSERFGSIHNPGKQVENVLRNAGRPAHPFSPGVSDGDRPTRWSPTREA